ncbi:MAG: CcmD family protein [Ginsengibacter sp.]
MVKSNLRRLCLTVSTFFLSSFIWAQTSPDTLPVTTDTVMRSNDKIYVVMAVCIIILVVFFLYLIRIDIKISKKEKIV